MAGRAWTVLLVGLVLVIGAIRTLMARRETRASIKFAEEFLEYLRAYISSRGAHLPAYDWLTNRSLKMQRELGASGVFAHYRRGGSDQVNFNVPVVLNLLPELRALYEQGARLPFDVPVYIDSMLVECIVRHVGAQQEIESDLTLKARNPVQWLRSGIQSILLSPMMVLVALGLAGTRIVKRVADHPLFKLMSGLSALIFLLAAVVTILVGWDAATVVFGRLVGR